ncbi:TIGR02587 family membrane protein [Salmonirosea aquatica]|uniref:TIGR02587 family membrane protein n=1 Tax=Salmonirosea aquatica TaxID=2654236 RepID=A0A7C9BEU3_9BACT|nr:TIGR02587 family membrane protein [Cytophagaceae bacterium SJW1-29]
MKPTSATRPLRESLREYGRGIAGGLLFSFPLLYTMEVWWAGFIASSFQLILIILFTYLLLLGYNRYAGMHPDASWKDVLVDSVEELGLGFLLAFAMLLMLRRIELGSMSTIEIMGKVIIEAMVMSIGISIGTAQLGFKNGSEEEAEQEKKDLEKERQSGLVGLTVLGFCGAIVVGGNVAPTEEVLAIGLEAQPAHILAMALVSIAMCTLILFYANSQDPGSKNVQPDYITIALQTCLCYLIALGASAVLLWFFGRLEGVSLWTGFAQCIALGVLSSLGSSAGRLLIN